MADTVKKSAPWYGLYHELEALFGCDPEIKLAYEEGDGEDEWDTIKMYVKSDDKRRALKEIIIPDCEFKPGKEVRIEILPSLEQDSVADIYRKAFKGNPLFSEVLEVPIGNYVLNYLMFKPKVVQYWDDNLGDPYGNVSTLAQEIAADVLSSLANIRCCTEPLSKEL